MTQPIRILVADDHPVMLAAISQFLDIQDDMVVVGKASTGGEAVEMARELNPDVVLMDYQMPETRWSVSDKRNPFSQSRIWLLSAFRFMKASG